jgi:hypothetical protein
MWWFWRRRRLSGRRGVGGDVGGDEGLGFVAFRGGVGWAACGREVMHIMMGGVHEYDHIICTEVVRKLQ